MTFPDGDLQRPTFSTQLPDTKGKPMIWVGEGKKRRQIPDMLAGDVTIPGKKEMYREREDFEKELARIGGQTFKEEIMTLFARRLVELAS